MDKNQEKKQINIPGAAGTDDLSVARWKRRQHKIQLMLAAIIVLTILLVWLIASNTVALVSAGSFMETLRINYKPGPGFPQQTGIGELLQWQDMGGGFVLLGQENCSFYTKKGERLRHIQAGYARPAISAGDSRFVLYNRGGTELRVEGRMKTLYTQNYPNGILLCEMGQSGSLAVVTEDPSFTAQLMVYSNEMEAPLTWKMTSAEGVPMRMAFSSNERKLAVATLSAKDGKTLSQVYVLDRSKEKQFLVGSRESSVPLEMHWVGDALMVVYNTGVEIYHQRNGVMARYDLNGQTLVDCSYPNGSRLALLVENGSSAEVILLNKRLEETGRFQTQGGSGINLTRNSVYVYTDTAVLHYSLKGELNWQLDCKYRPQRLFQSNGKMLMFQGGEIQVCAKPKAK